MLATTSAQSAPVSRVAPTVRRTIAVKKPRRRSIGAGMAALLSIAVLALILAYVAMTAELTAQTYRLVDERAERSALNERNNDLRQKVARLESLPRLQSAAAALQMREPTQFADLAQPASMAARRPPSRLVIRFDGMTDWLRAW
ncbi:MAG: hypothetical protein GIW99_00930 [Candidatus Eremiobacteraeota bacterium]|nr:hypothetical protein [Candidatus Eremiobacteraeota bacterium]MBC5826250.1 hypothetical protein [Candidatus Eremiobacteraeota bacterium]